VVTSTFGSWTYDGFQLDIGFTNNASIDTDSYIQSNEWNLVGYPARRNLIYYQGLVEAGEDQRGPGKRLFERTVKQLS